MRFVLCLFLLSSFSFGQKNSVFSGDIIFTSRMLKETDLSKDINTTSNFKFGQPLNYVGISSTGYFSNHYSRTTNYGFSSLEIMIPQTIQINDSLLAKINGSNFGLTTGFNLFNSMQYFDVLVCVGFNTGRVRLNIDDEFKQKNPYFSPIIAIAPRIIRKSLSLQLRCSYGHDISKGNWLKMRLSEKDMLDLGKFSSSGFNFTIGVGYHIY